MVRSRRQISGRPIPSPDPSERSQRPIQTVAAADRSHRAIQATDPNDRSKRPIPRTDLRDGSQLLTPSTDPGDRFHAAMPSQDPKHNLTTDPKQIDPDQTSQGQSQHPIWGTDPNEQSQRRIQDRPMPNMPISSKYLSDSSRPQLPTTDPSDRFPQPPIRDRCEKWMGGWPCTMKVIGVRKADWWMRLNASRCV